MYQPSNSYDRVLPFSAALVNRQKNILLVEMSCRKYSMHFKFINQYTTNINQFPKLPFGTYMRGQYVLPHSLTHRIVTVSNHAHLPGFN